MGEIADMILDGTLCQYCGEYMGEGDGFARSCCGRGASRGPKVKANAPKIRTEAYRARKKRQKWRKRAVAWALGQSLLPPGFASMPHDQRDGILKELEARHG